MFAFFKGVNKAAQGGILTETVAGGLPDGNYKLSSINSAANHQPVLVAVAQHGSLDDAVYFTVGQGQGAAAGGNGAQAGGGSKSRAPPLALGGSPRRRTDQPSFTSPSRCVVLGCGRHLISW